ncbi:TRAP transporter substrate-binding protein DctP [Kiloniella litopenaei]|uniref:TRAP transporter substrate-binding protein DctP n=1 Tax=Kiloniella litopenaei TaxID=1549748 RepID=UPI003BAA65D0
MLKKFITPALIAGSICIGTVANAAEITWRMPAAISEGSFFYKNFMERFAANVEVTTGGKLEVQPFGAGVIVPAFKVYEAVQDGLVDAGHSTPSYLVNQDPTNAIFASFPGGMSGEATLHWVYNGGGEKMLQDFRREKMGLHSIVVGIGTSEFMAHSNKEIKSTADLKGLKYRTSGAWAAVVKETYGGIPTVVPGGEIYTLLQRKGVDAIEWSTPGANLSEGFHEAAPYIIMPGVHQPSFLWEVFVKAETWDALSDELKAQIEAAAKLTTYESYAHFGNTDIKAMAEYKKTNVKMITLDNVVVEELRESGRNWARKKAKELADAGDTSMQTIMESYFAYQKAWAENSEYRVRDIVK